MVQAKEMQDRGVPVVDVHSAFDGFVSMLVGGAVAEAAFDSAAGHPGGVAFGVMVAAVASLAMRCAAEFAGP